MAKVAGGQNQVGMRGPQGLGRDDAWRAFLMADVACRMIVTRGMNEGF